MTRKSTKTRTPLTTHAEKIDILIGAVESIAGSEQWGQFLSQQRRLHGYSPNNRLWFYLQGLQRGIDTSTVASYGTWKELGRQVQYGEHGLAALAPVLVRKTDEATGETKKVLVGFRVIHQSFGISQTKGDPIVTSPAEPTLLEGDHDGWDSLVAYAASLGAVVTKVGPKILGGANGSTDYDLNIQIRSDISTAQAVKTLIHEIAHIQAGHIAAGASDYARHRGTKEVQAESIAYIVSSELGLDTGDYTFGYVASWAAETRNADKPGAEIEESLRVISDTADTILADLAAIHEAEQTVADAVVSDVSETV